MFWYMARDLYAIQAVAFGMGGGLLQKVNRDTMSFATKLSFIRCSLQPVMPDT